MKNFAKILTVITFAALFSGVLTSCEPDDVYDFADGYQQGYNKWHSPQVEPQGPNATEDINLDENVDLEHVSSSDAE